MAISGINAMQSMVHIDIVMILPSGGLIPTPFFLEDFRIITHKWYCHNNETLLNSIHNKRVYITTQFASTFPTQGIPPITVYDSHHFYHQKVIIKFPTRSPTEKIGRSAKSSKSRFRRRFRPTARRQALPKAPRKVLETKIMRSLRWASGCCWNEGMTKMTRNFLKKGNT